MDTVIIKAFI